VKALVDFYLGNAKLVRETFAARGLQCVVATTRRTSG
jgi:hypothetical protein